MCLIQWVGYIYVCCLHSWNADCGLYAVQLPLGQFRVRQKTFKLWLSEILNNCPTRSCSQMPLLKISRISLFLVWFISNHLNYTTDKWMKMFNLWVHEPVYLVQFKPRIDQMYLDLEANLTGELTWLMFAKLFSGDS